MQVRGEEESELRTVQLWVASSLVGLKLVIMCFTSSGGGATLIPDTCVGMTNPGGGAVGMPDPGSPEVGPTEVDNPEIGPTEAGSPATPPIPVGNVDVAPEAIFAVAAAAAAAAIATGSNLGLSASVGAAAGAAGFSAGCAEAATSTPAACPTSKARIALARSVSVFTHSDGFLRENEQTPPLRTQFFAGHFRRAAVTAAQASIIKSMATNLRAFPSRLGKASAATRCRRRRRHAEENARDISRYLL